MSKLPKPELRPKSKVVSKDSKIKPKLAKIKSWLIMNVARIILVALASWTLYEKAENDYLVVGMFLIGMVALVHWAFNNKEGL